ncbi:hypothetical protein L1887_56129 [Cichorium endivia]|nr:hypothetical protein L1887_56129 [Cichorium endivia]
MQLRTDAAVVDAIQNRKRTPHASPPTLALLHTTSLHSHGNSTVHWSDRAVWREQRCCAYTDSRRPAHSNHQHHPIHPASAARAEMTATASTARVSLDEPSSSSQPNGKSIPAHTRHRRRQ